MSLSLNVVRFFRDNKAQIDIVEKRESLLQELLKISSELAEYASKETLSLSDIAQHCRETVISERRNNMEVSSSLVDNIDDKSRADVWNTLIRSFLQLDQDTCKATAEQLGVPINYDDEEALCEFMYNYVHQAYPALVAEALASLP